jgi:hypothetical protein
MSVQAHDGAYCTPRSTGADKYSEAEIGYPSEHEELILDYAENPLDPTETVYGYVPRQLVETVVAKHGGIISGELPAGFSYLRAPQQ